MLKQNEGIATWLVAMLSVMAGISVANLYYCQPLLNLIREDVGLTEFQVNLMPVSTQVGYAVGLLFILPMGDLYNRRTTILTCFGVLIGSLLTLSVSCNAPMLLAASFVTGVCSVAPQVFIPFVSQFSRPEEKARKVGLVLSGLLIGILASRVVSGYVGHMFGWRTMYVIAASIIALSALILFKAFPYVSPTFHGRFTQLLRSILQLARRHPLSLRYSIRSAFAFGSLLGMWGCLAFRIKEAPFFEGSDVVGLLGLCGVAGALTASNVGRYVPRYGVERINGIGQCLIIVSWVIMYFLQDSYAGLIAGIVLIDIGMQCIQLSNQSATLRLEVSASSRMNTIYMTIYFVGGSLGTFLAGTMWTLFGWTGTVLSGLALMLLSLCVNLLSPNKK